jgi:vitamin B12 transporter
VLIGYSQFNLYQLRLNRQGLYSQPNQTTMKILYTCLSVSLFILANESRAQTDSSQLSDITISSNRIDAKINTTSRSITVLHKKDLNLLSGLSPNNWLSTVSGVDIRQRGPEGIQADIGIRGGSFDQSLVLLNGMKLSDPQTGHHMMNLPMTSEAIEQIDVIKTAASRLYGINALTGSVNFITKVPEKNMAYLGAYAGDFGLYGIKAGITLNTKKIGQHISVARSSSNGYKPNTDFVTNQLFYQATIKAGKGQLNVLGGFTSREFGASGFYAPQSTEFEHTQTAFGGLQYEVKWNHWKLKSQVYYRYNDDDYIYVRAKPELYHNHHYSHVAGAEIHATYTSFLGETGLGVDSRTEKLNSNNLGDRQRDIFGAFAEHRFSFLQRKLLVTPGIYVNSYTGNNLAAFPGIDASYIMLPSLVAFASVDKGMRLPTYTDLYYNGPTNIGNPNLKTEEALNYEAGLKFNKSSWLLSAAGFIRQSKNLIDWARPDVSQKWEPLNINTVTFKGVETLLYKSFKHMLKQASVSYTFINANFYQPENYISRYTLSNIRHQVIGNLTINWFKNLNQSITVRHINRVTMADYTLLDSKLTYGFKYVSVFADVSNILNTSYQEAGYVSMPGRWFKVGFDIKLYY